MKRFRYFYNDEIVPPEYYEDTNKLRKFIRESLRIDISLNDTYLLWDSISRSWYASWLFIDTHPEGETREEFLLREMEKRGIIQ